MSEEVLETYTMTPEEEIKWLRNCVRELQQENKQLKNNNKILNTQKETAYKIADDYYKENNQLKKQLEYLRSGEYLNQLKFERNMLEDIVQNTEVSKEDKEFIDMTHRNTELLEVIEELENKLNEDIQDLNNMMDGIIRPSELIKSLELYLQILDKAKEGNNDIKQ